MIHVLMAKNRLLCPRVTHSLNHGGVIVFIRQKYAVGQMASQRAESGFIGNIARCEKQSRWFAMEIAQFPLQHDMIVGCAGYVTRAATACATLMQGVLHGLEHGGMLSHGEIIIAAPHHHLINAVFVIIEGVGEFAHLALEIGEDAVSSFFFDCVQAIGKKVIVVHERRSSFFFVMDFLISRNLSFCR